MLSHVQIFCFLASYTVALALEVSRLWFRSGIRGIVMLGFVVAGWIAHTAFLCNSAVEAAGSPLSSNRDWLLLAAWVLVMVYFYLACYHPTTHFGVFLLPLVLGLITVARFADKNPFPREPASKIWGVIHGTSIMLATVAVLVGFAAGLMYLEQAGRLKRKRPPYLKFRLPSLEWLQTVNSRSMLASMLLVGVAVASGIVLNLLKQSPGALWKDPVVWLTLAMFAWLLLHVVIGAFYRPIRQGRKVAYLTMVSFIFLVFALVGMFVSRTHGGGGGNAQLQIANCKLQIANFGSGLGTSDANSDRRTRFEGAIESNRASPMASRPQFSIFNFQFSICNSTLLLLPRGGLS